jgi:hypothetical protein
MKGEPGEYACLVCGQPLESWSGETYIAYRLTVPPEPQLVRRDLKQLHLVQADAVLSDMN